jgi:hypothetical protein
VKIICLLILLFLTFSLAEDVTPTISTASECGGSIESEFTQPAELHEYTVSMNAGDTLQISIVPIGNYLETAIAIAEPAGDIITSDFERKKTPMVETEILSARGDYKIYVFNYRVYGNAAKGQPDVQLQPFGNTYAGRAGTYTILITCVLRDGTEIQGGSSQ